MATINFTVEGHSVRVDNLIELAQGSNNFDTCAFSFDSVWDGFVLYAVMYQNPKNVFKLPLDAENTRKIPQEVLQKDGWVYIGARGEKEDTDETIVTSMVVKLPVRKGAVNGNETGQEMLDQSQYEYLLGKVNELNEKCESLTKELENQNGTGTGTGLSTEAIDKLEEVGNYLAYTTADGVSKWMELISILRNGSSGDDSGNGDDPDVVPSTDYTWLYTADSGVPLSERTDILTASENVLGGLATETINNSGNLQLVTTATIGGGAYKRFDLTDNVCISGKLTAYVKFNAIAAGNGGTQVSGGSGFRLQLSNGTAGAAVFTDVDNDSGQGYLGVYTEKNFERIGTINTGVWYKLKVVLDSTGQSVYLDDDLLYNTVTLSTNYCTKNSILNQASVPSVSSPNGYISDVEIAWIEYKKVS